MFAECLNLAEILDAQAGFWAGAWRGEDAEQKPQRPEVTKRPRPPRPPAPRAPKPAPAPEPAPAPMPPPMPPMPRPHKQPRPEPEPTKDRRRPRCTVPDCGRVTCRPKAYKALCVRHYLEEVKRAGELAQDRAQERSAAA